MESGFCQHATRLAGGLATTSVFVRYDKVALGEEGENLQVADYCAWATFRKGERADDRSFRTIVDAGMVCVESPLERDA